MGAHPIPILPLYCAGCHFLDMSQTHIVPVSPDFAVGPEDRIAAALCQTPRAIIAAVVTINLLSRNTCARRDTLLSPYHSQLRCLTRIQLASRIIDTSLSSLFRPSSACRHRRDSGVIAAAFLVTMSFPRSTIRPQTLAKVPLLCIPSHGRQICLLVEGVSLVLRLSCSPKEKKKKVI
jgi:hypothetical protein